MDDFKSQGLFLFGDFSRCFEILFSFSLLKLQTNALVDLKASAYFIVENFAKSKKISLVKKPYSIPVEIKDGQPLVSGYNTHETIPLEIELEGYNNFVIFNVIKSSTTSVILGLSWLRKYNLDIDWNNLKIRSFPKFQSTKSIKPIFQCPKPLFIGARAFMRAAKNEESFIVYATPTFAEIATASTLPQQYQAYEDVFEKKNADILSKHRPYNCAIDLEDGAQPLFGPIYSFSQDELAALHEYIDENLAKNFIQHSKPPVGVPILFVKKKDRSLQMCVDYCGLNKVTIKNRYLLLLIFGLLDPLG